MIQPRGVCDTHSHTLIQYQLRGKLVRECQMCVKAKVAIKVQYRLVGNEQAECWLAGKLARVEGN